MLSNYEIYKFIFFSLFSWLADTPWGLSAEDSWDTSCSMTAGAVGETDGGEAVGGAAGVEGVVVEGVEGLTAGTTGMIGGGVAEEAEEDGGVAVAEDVGEWARI